MGNTHIAYSPAASRQTTRARAHTHTHTHTSTHTHMQARGQGGPLKNLRLPPLSLPVIDQLSAQAPTPHGTASSAREAAASGQTAECAPTGNLFKNGRRLDRVQRGAWRGPAGAGRGRGSSTRPSAPAACESRAATAARSASSSAPAPLRSNLIDQSTLIDRFALIDQFTRLDQFAVIDHLLD